MLREIITLKSNEHAIHIPKEYINIKVEILVLPFNDTQTLEPKEDIFKKTAGILSSKNIDSIKC